MSVFLFIITWSAKLQVWVWCKVGNVSGQLLHFTSFSSVLMATAWLSGDVMHLVTAPGTSLAAWGHHGACSKRCTKKQKAASRSLVYVDSVPEKGSSILTFYFNVNIKGVNIFEVPLGLILIGVHCRIFNCSVQITHIYSPCVFSLGVYVPQFWTWRYFSL